MSLARLWRVEQDLCQEDWHPEWPSPWRRIEFLMISPMDVPKGIVHQNTWRSVESDLIPQRDKKNNWILVDPLDIHLHVTFANARRMEREKNGEDLTHYRKEDTK
jgi:hypothetical protein